MQESITLSRSRTPQFVLFALVLAGGLLVFLFGANTFDPFPTNRNAIYEWGITLLFLAAALALRRSERLHPYWTAAYALFTASFANAFNLLLGNWLGRLLPSPVSDAQAIAIDKLSQGIPIVLAIVALTLLARDDLGSIFLKRGDLKQGLRFGLISFGVFAIIFAVIAVLQSNAPVTSGLTATGVSLSTILAALPWILVFVFANSIMEELWIRGVFLARLRPLLGSTLTVLVTALVFGISHSAGTYITPIQAFIFPVIVFVLGLVNATVMLKTGSIWGSVFFHAGYDLLVIIPILVSL